VPESRRRDRLARRARASGAARCGGAGPARRGRPRRRRGARNARGARRGRRAPAGRFNLGRRALAAGRAPALRDDRGAGADSRPLRGGRRAPTLADRAPRRGRPRRHGRRQCVDLRGQRRRLLARRTVGCSCSSSPSSHRSWRWRSPTGGFSFPALSGDAVRVGRPALRNAGRIRHDRAVLALALLAVVAAMGVTAPAGSHEQPTWPLPFRLTLARSMEPVRELPVLIGSQVVVLGLVGLAIAALVSAGRRLIVVAALALLVTGLALAGARRWPWDGLSTTYRRSDVPYSATSSLTAPTAFGVTARAATDRPRPVMAATRAGCPPAGRSPLAAHRAAHRRRSLLVDHRGHPGRRQCPGVGQRSG